jgi:hypothetical protein
MQRKVLNDRQAAMLSERGVVIAIFVVTLRKYFIIDSYQTPAR